MDPQRWVTPSNTSARAGDRAMPSTITTKKATNSYARTQMVEKALESAMESEGVEPTEADSSAKTVVIKVGDIVDTANGDIASGDIITNGKETTKTAKNTTSGKTYKETAAEKKEKESKQSLRSVLVVSTAVEAGIIFFAVQRQKKINEVEAEIRSMSSQTEDISEEVNAREERLRELSKKIHLISNDLRKLNPLGSSGNSSGDGGGGSDSFPRVAKPKGL